MREFDIRILKLNKWYVPKTHDLNGAGKQVVIGYFDDVDVVPIEREYGEEHPFIEGYNQLVNWKREHKRELVDHSSQEQILFAKISDKKEIGFSEEEIKEFWANKDWPYRFISMVHVSHSGKIEKALKIIRKIFRKEYLCYISFDYCDLVIFAQGIYIKDYLDKIKKLFQEEDGNLFFDSFSMVSFNDSYLKEGNIPEGAQFEAGCRKDKFLATVNLSIRDYDKFKVWYGEFEKDSRLYNMFGRYDVSIVHEADTVWLFKIMKKLHEKENQDIFWTFETFIKIKERSKNRYVVDAKHLNSKYYETIKKNLGGKIEELCEIVENSSLINKDNFILPICEVRDCICSIIKNNFAEELIYCIYESFYEFIVYMIKTIGKLDEYNGTADISEKKIAECYDHYFTALNALVNSTMNSDRQFIQATAFNAIFYSIPPKIMAFYNVYIYRLKKIFMDRDKVEEKRISYLIYPSFSPEVSTEKISLEENPPCERILKVKVNEKALYDISLVTYQLVHEMAHSIGNRIRCRTVRMENMFRALLRYIMGESNVVDGKIQKAYEKYLKEIWLEEKLKGNYLDNFLEKSACFLIQLPIATTEKIPSYLEDIYMESMEEDISYNETIGKIGIENISEQKQYLKYYMPQYCQQVGYELNEKTQKVQNNSRSKKKYEAMVRILYSTYYECYADLQMILVLKVSPEDYLRIFLTKDGISVEELLHNFEDVIRICTIFKVMMDCGMWKVKNVSESNIDKLIRAIKYYNDVAFAEFPDIELKQRIKSLIFEIKEQLKSFCDTKKCFKSQVFGDRGDDYSNIEIMDLEVTNILLFDLYEYLLHVVKETLIEHRDEKKREEINKIQKSVSTMIEERDIIKVYNCIETELQEYGKELLTLK